MANLKWINNWSHGMVIGERENIEMKLPDTDLCSSLLSIEGNLYYGRILYCLIHVIMVPD
jgi:hypothetical protein